MTTTVLNTGKEVTLVTLFTDFREMVFNRALSVVKNYHDAEDICSDVFVKIDRLMKNDATRFDASRSAAKTWVYTITNSVILDFFRTSKSDKYTSLSDFVDSAGNEVFNFIAQVKNNADAKVLTSEIQEKIRLAFGSLKIKYRRVAVLYFLKEYEYSEIAEMLNIPLGTVKGYIFRIREQLQCSLNDVSILTKVH